MTIATITTRELIVKDFATELNDDRVRKAGHMAAAKLAGSLALVTCKEPLKTNLPIHIRTYLNENGFNEVGTGLFTPSYPTKPTLKCQTMIQEQIVLLISQENLDVACEAIEKAAMDRAMGDIDEVLAASMDTRRRHREVRLLRPIVYIA